MLLMRALEMHHEAISGECHIVPFSAFLLWRKTRPAGAAIHLFGLPVIVSSDGAVIAIRMGQRTANPGRVYCAAGSLDTDDIRDGYCDIDGNMAREVLEETGLSLSDATSVTGFHGLRGQDVVTLFRAYHFAATAVGTDRANRCPYRCRSGARNRCCSCHSHRRSGATPLSALYATSAGMGFQHRR
jgi:8-oxo-dGTP pyrophosphatase MutT (NUDIX family)